MKQCIKSLLTLDCGLTEAEVVQIANSCPQSDVEFYLVTYVPFIRTLCLVFHLEAKVLQ